MVAQSGRHGRIRRYLRRISYTVPWVLDTTYSVPSGLSLMSGVTPKFSPKSSDSLSVISYLPRLSATLSLQALVVDVDLLAVVGDLQAEDVAAAQRAAGRADEQIALVVLAELLGGEEVDAARGDLVLPRHLRIGELRAGELEQAVVGLARRVGDVDRVPADLLEPVVAVRGVAGRAGSGRGSSRSP